MNTTRKGCGPNFKAKVNLATIQRDMTLAELATKDGVHHTMIAA